MKKRLDKCPSCGTDLQITEYAYQNCKAKIIGSFSQGELSSLPEELLAFLKAFIKNRRNLSEFRKELNIPYSTARSKTGITGNRYRIRSCQPSSSQSIQNNQEARRVELTMKRSLSF